MKLVMVQGGALGFGVGASVSGGVFVILSTPKTKAFVDDKGVYAGPLSWTFSGGNAPGCASGTVVGSGTIQPGSQDMSVENQAVVLLDDQVSVTFNGTSPGGNPVSIPGQPVKVATAGQSSAWAD